MTVSTEEPFYFRKLSKRILKSSLLYLITSFETTFQILMVYSHFPSSQGPPTQKSQGDIYFESRAYIINEILLSLLTENSWKSRATFSLFVSCFWPLSELLTAIVLACAMETRREGYDDDNLTKAARPSARGRRRGALMNLSGTKVSIARPCQTLE